MNPRPTRSSLTSPRTPYLCLGYHDVYDAVLDRAAVARRGLPVLRRRVGGGTTYLDSNQIFYQCVFHHARVPPVFGGLRDAGGAPAALRRLRADASQRHGRAWRWAGGASPELAAGGSARRPVVGNPLLDFDYEAMVAVWRAPWPAYRALAAAELRDRVDNPAAARRHDDASTPSRRCCARSLRTLGRPLLPGALTPAETRPARRLGARMADPDYLDLHGDRPVDRPGRLKIAAGVFLHAAIANIAGYLAGKLRWRATSASRRPGST
ncbi:MAG: lipoate--protein ligase family protein [Kouleothrix sp.]|nr:lipoate--protein ligase family protein [Kouleothrix sp.]